ncbi:Uncharacterized conserved protein YgiM [Pseudomonas syringae pv. actinidiae]|uniref:Uncharacterized conserved protein YgiM n=1 Tax=Pseudomonas syringae pv. actinidiae TaxID=103796 RepID=A0A2V0QGF5_PSESF|nr:Uncharacterized conserved protein YgiM [Pseudomonas syringae pv. actinidiae]GBH19345.1 Uncharacterized conserved protein YgiM [Pseudomonas syringae pv. actinidiae]
MHAHADPQIVLAYPLQQLDTQDIGDGFDLFDEGQGGVAEQNLFRPAILDHGLALNQALFFKAVEQPREGRSFYSHALRQLALGGRLGKTGEVQQDQPARLRKAEVSQPTIQLGAPAPGEVSELHPETMFVSQWHKVTRDSN